MRGLCRFCSRFSSSASPVVAYGTIVPSGIVDTTGEHLTVVALAHASGYEPEAYARAIWNRLMRQPMLAMLLLLGLTSAMEAQTLPNENLGSILGQIGRAHV